MSQNGYGLSHFDSMMILAVFNERVRVRADTPRGVVPPRQVATTAKLRNYNFGFGAVLGPALGVFERMTPNRLALQRKCLLPDPA